MRNPARFFAFSRLFLLVFAAVTALSSCLNLIEYIGKEPNGNTRVSFVFTVSTSVLALAQQSGESADSIFGSMTSAFDELKKQVPAGVEVTSHKIHNTQQFGYQMTIIYPPSMLQKLRQEGSSAALVPLREGSNIVVHFGNSAQPAQSQNSSSDSMGQLMLSSDEFQLLISKNYAKTVKGAVFTDQTNTVEMTEFDFGQFYMLQMPVSYLVQSSGDAKITIHT